MGERATLMDDVLPGNDRGADTLESDDPAVLAAQIEHTRAEMSGTIEALQDRLAPENLADQAKETATEVTDHARDAAKETIHYAITDAKAAVRELIDDGTVARLREQVVGAAAQMTDQAKEAAKEAATHAVDEARTAVQELGGQATGAMRAATLGRVEQAAGITRVRVEETGTDMMTLIRSNPLPAAVAAIGLGWLWMQRSSETKPVSTYRGPSGNGMQPNGLGALTHQVADQAQQMAGQVGEQVGAMVSQAHDMTGHGLGHVQDAAGSMQSSTKSTMQSISADPLALAAVGVALGAAVAILLPSTDQEHQLMGEARERMVDQVQTLGGETVEKVQRVAAEVGKAAVQEVSAQGLGKAASEASTS